MSIQSDEIVARWSAFIELIDNVKNCKSKDKCKLCGNMVFGTGPLNAELVIVGEAAGETEEILGIPFVGLAGLMLTKMLAAIGIDRTSVYICNTVKGRPPEDRKPTSEELSSCRHFLIDQIAIVRPKVILCLGETAAQAILSCQEKVTALRGKVIDWSENAKTKVIVTYHPIYLCKKPSAKGEAMKDLLLLKSVLDQLNQAPVVNETVAVEAVTTCDTCAGRTVKIRGLYPKDPEVEVCPTCMRDRIHRTVSMLVPLKVQTKVINV
jgi:DNA polymerase